VAAFIDPFADLGKAQYLAVPRRTGIAATTFIMMIVGAPEIVAGLMVPFKPSFGGYWLACGGIINLMQAVFSATALTQSAPARLLRSNHLDDSAGRDALLGTPGYCRGAPFSGSAQTGTRSKIIQLSEIFPNRARLSIF
jgi:hypothetical protein